MKVWIAVGALVGLAACATSYSGDNFLVGGGVESARLNERLLEIQADGNAQTPTARIFDFVKLKAAEETLKYGFTHFVIIEAADTTRSSTVYSSNAYVPLASSTMTTNIMPGQVARVVMLTAEEADIAAFDAQIVWDELAPKYISD